VKAGVNGEDGVKETRAARKRLKRRCFLSHRSDRPLGASAYRAAVSTGDVTAEYPTTTATRWMVTWGAVTIHRDHPWGEEAE
jgi:hypothetical protein